MARKKQQQQTRLPAALMLASAAVGFPSAPFGPTRLDSANSQLALAQSLCLCVCVCDSVSVAVAVCVSVRVCARLCLLPLLILMCCLRAMRRVGRQWVCPLPVPAGSVQGKGKIRREGGGQARLLYELQWGLIRKLIQFRLVCVSCTLLVVALSTTISTPPPPSPPRTHTHIDTHKYIAWFLCFLAEIGEMGEMRETKSTRMEAKAKATLACLSLCVRVCVCMSVSVCLCVSLCLHWSC